MRTLRARIAVNWAKHLAALATLLFVAAGTLRFVEAWVYLGLQAASTAAINLYLLRRDPMLLERRLVLDEQGEREPVQRVVIGCSRAVGAGMLVLAGLDRRFGWSHVPREVLVVAWTAFALGTAIIFVVFRANTFTTSIITVEPTQTVVTNGPYRWVRHPMYAGALMMGLATPLSLGSYWTELAMPIAVALLVVRLLAEERFLAERLEGYAQYMRATRARLLPLVW